MNKKEYQKQYRLKNKERIAEKKKQYYLDNKERIDEYQKQYRDANKERLAEYNKEYREENKERIAEKRKLYREKNKERIAEKKKEYEKQHRKTPAGRASMLVKAYNRLDKIAGRDKGNLTPKYVHDNILFKECVYCGLSDWTKIGCNRIDNSKPHTTDNVEPCCYLCNCKQNGKYMAEKTSKQVYQYTKDGELVGIYESVAEAARQNGFVHSGIINCCNGKRKTYKNYIWSYVPLEF